MDMFTIDVMYIHCFFNGGIISCHASHTWPISTWEFIDEEYHRLRASRVLSLYDVYGNSALLVLNGTYLK